MDGQSPLRTWVRKHSPLRNKPLPVPPQDNAPSEPKRTIQSTAADFSPSKRPSKSKLRSFLRQKPHPMSPPRSPPSPGRSNSRLERGRSVPLATDTNQQRSSIRKTLRRQQNSPDLRGLSKKISSLEAQLQEARKELENVSGNVAPGNSKETADYAPTHDSRNRQKPRQSYTESSIYEDIAENLLGRRDEERVLHALTRKSQVDLGHAQNEEELFMSPQDDDIASFSDTEVRHHKRKRSELRQVSWDRVQSHIQKQQQMQVQQQVPEPKRLRSSRHRSLDGIISPRSKQLPQLPDFPTPKISKTVECFLQSSADGEDENKCPPLNRHQRHFSQPPELPSNSAPKTKGHSRRRSQIIEPEQLREAFGDITGAAENMQNRNSHPAAIPVSQVGSDGYSRRASLPSPSRHQCHSRSQLDKVDEEFEWDEDIF